MAETENEREGADSANEKGQSRGSDLTEDRVKSDNLQHSRDDDDFSM
jgi:hypothetical protein